MHPTLTLPAGFLMLATLATLAALVTSATFFP
jgi:hypothetical protein